MTDAASTRWKLLNQSHSVDLPQLPQVRRCLLLGDFDALFKFRDLGPTSDLTMPNELVLAIQYSSEIPRAAVQLLKVPWIDVFIDQDREKLVGVKQILSISFQIGHINGVFIKDVLNQP